MSEIQDRAILQKKQDLKNALRQEYWKKMTEPVERHPGAYLMDPGLQRVQAIQPTRIQYFRPTMYSGMLYTVFFIIPLIGVTTTIKMRRDKKEHAYRTGQVSYADRQFKFV